MASQQPDAGVVADGQPGDRLPAPGQAPAFDPGLVEAVASAIGQHMIIRESTTQIAVAALNAAAACQAAAIADPMFERAYMDVQAVLDKALGIKEEDGAGAGIAADVALLVSQRDKARAEAAQLAARLKELTEPGLFEVVPSSAALTACGHPADHRCVDCATGGELLAAIPDVRSDLDAAGNWVARRG